MRAAGSAHLEHQPQTRMVPSRKILKRSALGAIVALALGALSLVNWAQRGRFGVPEDGVTWADSEAGVLASRVESKSPAALVGVRPGDLLRSIAGAPVEEALDATRLLADIGAWNRTEYELERAGQPLHLSLVVAESSGRGAVGGFLLILGWAYGLIGLLVWLRCPANASTHRFYAFCLASLAVYALSSTGALDGFDRLIYWLDVWALLLMPALFLDFCLHFPDHASRLRGLSRLSFGAAVAVGAAHHATAGGWVTGGIGESEMLRFFETAPLVLLVFNLLAAAYGVHDGARLTRSAFHRLQRGWLLHGSLAAVLPFGAFYVVPFIAGRAPGPNESFSVLSLAVLPAAIAMALFRYRLLDLEILWRRAASSAVTAGLLVAGGSLVLFPGGTPAPWLDRYGPLAWLVSLAAAAALFHPLRNWMLRILERRFYRERYDDRRTLAAFASELASDTDLDRMVRAVGDRLAQTLQVDRVAILTSATDPDPPRFRLLFRHGLDAAAPSEALDLTPLAARGEGGHSSVLLTDSAPGVLPASIAILGCSHYVACRLRGRTLAWIGLGRTRRGTFLNSDDLALVKTLAGPFAIALENARLYASLEHEATQYQQLKDYNENIVESLSVGILVVDLEGRVQSWNTQLELVFHISRDQAVGRHLRALLPAALVDQFERCQDETGAGNVYKFRLRASAFPEEFRPAATPDPGERIVNLAVAPLIAKDFRPIGRLLILDDVTERLELEERIVHADKLSSVGLLAAGVAHEVNTPLAVISSYAQMLAARFTDESDEAKMLGKMTEQTFRASEIVNSLLDFSRTSGARMTPCDMNRAIEDTLELIAPQLRQAGVSVQKELRGTASVLADRGKLQQVFLNLFLNARDAMPDGGALRIESSHGTTGVGARRVEVRVSDTGSGIAPALQRRIFDPFYTTKDPRRGTGLGLAVSYGIVQEHAGTISVDSEPGQGTTFTLTFPLARQPAHA